MKRIGLLFLAVVMAFGVAGCSKGKDADPVGKWFLIVDRGCDGSTSNYIWHIYAKGSFNDESGGSGTWAVSKDDITLSYDNGTNYGGTVNGDSMSGTMTFVGTGGTGCWTAMRTSTVP